MSKELKIYRQVGGLDIEITNQPELIIDNFTCYLPHLNSRRITAEFEYPRIIDFQLNEYVIYEKEGVFQTNDENAFEKYYLVKPPVVTKDEKSLMVKYSIEFVSKFDVLKNVVMVDSWEVLGNPDASGKPSLLQTEYSFFGGVNEYFTNIKSSMIAEFGSEFNAVYGTQPKGWIIEVDLNNGYPQEVDDMQVGVSQMTVFDALVDINDKFKVPFFFKNSNHIVIGGVKSIVSKQFRYGKDKGLVKIVKTPKDMSIINKIRGVGSERNIPYNYLASIKAAAGLPELPMNKLMPKIYRDTLELKATVPSTEIKDYYTLNYNEAFPKPSFETFDDIYPTITGAIAGDDNHPIDEITGVYFLGDDVQDENLMIVNGESQEPKHPRFWVRVPALGFDLNSCLNEKEPLLLTMTEGLCGGCKFKVAAIGANPKKWSAFNEGYSDFERMLIESKNVNVIGTNTSVQEFVSNEVECFDGDLLTANLKFKLGLNLAGAGSSQFRGEVSYQFGFYINGTNNIVFSGTYNSDTSIGDIVDDYILDSLVFPITASNQGMYKAYVYLSAENQYVGSGSETYFGGSFYSAFDDISVLVEHSPASKESVDTTNNPTWLLLQKDIETYNTTLPYVTSPIWTKYSSPEQYPAGAPATEPTGLVPKIGQKFVFFGISLPDTYIISAEQRLEDALESILLQNQEYKFNYDTVFDEKIFLESPELLNEVVPGATIEIFEETRPGVEPSQGDKIEVVINGLTLKYSSSKSITINAD